MRMRTKLLVPALLIIVLNSAVANGSSAATAVTPDEARAIAKEATIYGFPLVDNYRIQYAYFVDRSSKEYKAPWNHLHNDARVYTPEDRAVQTPNSDTPYSQLGADLRRFRAFQRMHYDPRPAHQASTQVARARHPPQRLPLLITHSAHAKGHDRAPPHIAVAPK